MAIQAMAERCAIGAMVATRVLPTLTGRAVAITDRAGWSVWRFASCPSCPICHLHRRSNSH